MFVVIIRIACGCCLTGRPRLFFYSITNLLSFFQHIKFSARWSLFQVSDGLFFTRQLQVWSLISLSVLLTRTQTVGPDGVTTWKFHSTIALSHGECSINFSLNKKIINHVKFHTLQDSGTNLVLPTVASMEMDYNILKYLFLEKLYIYSIKMIYRFLIITEFTCLKQFSVAVEISVKLKFLLDYQNRH